MTVQAEDTPPLGGLLITMVRWAGQTIDEETVARLVPLLGTLLADWELLTQAAAPGIEPMGCGRWPEVSGERE